MAIPATPTSFYLQTGNGNNFLSWDQISGTVSYLVQRSLDNVTFTLAATITGSPLNNYYLDSAYDVGSNPTGVVAGTRYYYKVAAQNGSGTSSYTSVLDAIPAPIGQVSLGYVRDMAQLRADLKNSQFVTLPEWNVYISNSYKYLYNLLIQKFEDEYYTDQTYTFTTVQNQQLYTLPNNFYKATLVEVSLNTNDPNSWVTLRRFNKIQQNLWNYPNVYTFYGITNIRYRFTGNNLQIVPATQANQTLRIWFAPRPAQLIQDTQLLDGIAGFEDLVILLAARKALVKQEQDVSEIDGELRDMYQRIDEAAANRDIGEPQTISDSKVRNFSWSDDFGGYGSGGMGWG